MTSKEALEYLTSKTFTGGNSILETEAEICANIIKQDLERLEMLEKENKDLKYIEIANLKHRLDEKNEIIRDLQQDYDDKDLECLALEQENEKLKKALCVFSAHLQIESGCQEEWLQFKNGEDQSDDLTREEYKLLKAVLGNKI